MAAMSAMSTAQNCAEHPGFADVDHRVHEQKANHCWNSLVGWSYVSLNFVILALTHVSQ